MNIRKFIPAHLKNKIKGFIDYDKNRFTFLGNDDSENELGKMQKDESIFLYGLIKVLRPKLVVEFGFLEGYSSSVILSALDKGSSLHSFDNTEYSRDEATGFTKRNPCFFFHNKNQEKFDPVDIGRGKIDFVLIDASHDLEINKTTFKKIKGSLTENCIIMIHDTGLWQKKFMETDHFTCLKTIESKWLDDERVAHQINERRFVNWIIETHIEFAVLNFGSSNTLRHGFSLVGSRKSLEV